MNIQIFGTNKCFDTKKAQRYFKERGVRFQMIDLKEKGMSRGEFENVARALGGWEKLVDPAAKDKQTLALLDALVDWQKEDKLFENQQLFKTPIVRNGRQATVGYQPMHVNFGLVPPLEDGKRRSKRDRYQAYADRALEALDAYLATRPDLFGGDRS